MPDFDHIDAFATTVESAVVNDHKPGIVAFALFTVCPTGEHAWLTAWQDLVAMARATPECHSFRLLTDLAPSTCYAVLREWDNRRALAAFWRDNHILWIEEALGHAEVPTVVYVFAAIPSEESGTLREYEWRESVRSGLIPATW